MSVTVDLRIEDVSPSSWMVEYKESLFWLRDDDVAVESTDDPDIGRFTIPQNIAQERGFIS